MNCTNSSIKLDETHQIFQLIVYIPLFLFGIICNSLAFWVFCCKLKTWTETRVYMTNLIISDCCLLFTFPFRIYSYKRKWDLGNKLCSALLSIYFGNMYMSIFTITLIAIDRYIAIKHPLKTKNWRSPLKAAAICGFLWILLISFFIYTALKYKNFQHTFCFQKSSTDPFHLVLTFIAVGFLVPLIIQSFCSIQIIRCLKNKEIMDLHEKRVIKKVIWIVSANLAVFIICFLPVHVAYLVRYVIETIGAGCFVRLNVHKFVHVATYLANANCFLDAVCYYFVAKEFWEASSLFSKIKFAQFSQDDQYKASQLSTQQ
ncbi:G-protein coupled receptor 35 isoform X2 [Microcaecilia unicolor]|nr:G-protein coupled receptor 35-like isoform X2 [Microcaecilia unicolor]XP_030072287.1 G-protein coupled receptor 35-like isoform X2 [Microcaecilia unicolor]